MTLYKGKIVKQLIKLCYSLPPKWTWKKVDSVFGKGQDRKGKGEKRKEEKEILNKRVACDSAFFVTPFFLTFIQLGL